MSVDFLKNLPQDNSLFEEVLALLTSSQAIHRCLEHIWQRFHLRARLFLREGENLVMRACVGNYQRCPEIGLQVHPDSIVWEVFRSGMAFNFTEPADLVGKSHTLPEPVPIKAIIPLKSAALRHDLGQTLGVLVVDAGDSSEPISQKDFQYLEVVGLLLGEILERSLIMEKMDAIQREKESMSQEVSHIFRNRFTAIGGAARRLEKALADPLLKRWAHIIVEEVARGEHVLNMWKKSPEKRGFPMAKETTPEKQAGRKGSSVLIGVDFSDSCRLALRRAMRLLPQQPERIVALHVIDSDFIEQCIRHRLGAENQIKRELFLNAKRDLQKFLQEEGMLGNGVQAIVTQGVPFVEINKQAIEHQVDMIIVGSCGKTGDMETIFFGSTAEKVLRFIARPVLCVPPDVEFDKSASPK
ncbi:MAG: universal stress protein [Deltaproteobacteria bacterium]|nr:universal stress protein [Deltaproteobacteria bacterium]MBW2070905.1 universal stress protein [Deltaproteobacteria bacterium]